MSNTFYKVEFDPSYTGGDYSSVGAFVLVPEDLVEKLGMYEAFEKTTGHVRANIVHYSEDDRFNAAGEQLGIEIPEPVVIEKAEEPKIDISEPWPIQKSENPGIEFPALQVVETED